MSINLPQLINTDFKPVAFIRTGKLPCESTFIFPFTYVYSFSEKYSINILLFPFLRYSCLWQRNRNKLTDKYNKKTVIPSIKGKSQSWFASRIYFFFQENFLYGLRHENSPEKECGGKRIIIKKKITGINCDRRDA